MPVGFKFSFRDRRSHGVTVIVTVTVGTSLQTWNLRVTVAALASIIMTRTTANRDVNLRIGLSMAVLSQRRGFRGRPVRRSESGRSSWPDILANFTVRLGFTYSPVPSSPRASHGLWPRDYSDLNLNS